MTEISRQLSFEDELPVLAARDRLAPAEALRCAQLRLLSSGQEVAVFEELSAHGFNGGFNGDDEAMKEAMRWAVEYHVGNLLPEGPYLQREYDRRERAWEYDKTHPKNPQ